MKSKIVKIKNNVDFARFRNGMYIALLAILACFIFIYIPIYLWRIFISIPESNQATIVATVLTVVGSVGSLIYSINRNRQREIEQALYQKKQPVYEGLLSFIFDVMEKNNKDEKVSEDEMMAFIMKFSKDLMLWGSDEVIEAYVKFRETSQSDPTSQQILFSLEDLIRAIRIDFGHKNKGIEQGDLLSFMVKDVKNYL